MNRKGKGPLKVLIVEDEMLVREFMEAAIPYAFQELKVDEFEIVTASSSKAAFAAIDTAGSVDPFDFLISDIQCDAEDNVQRGFGVVKTAKSVMPECVAFTMSGGAFASEEDILAMSLKVGAVAYLTKPITMRELASAVKKHFQTES